MRLFNRNKTEATDTAKPVNAQAVVKAEPAALAQTEPVKQKANSADTALLSTQADLISAAVEKAHLGSQQVEASTKQLLTVMETINEQTVSQRNAVKEAAGIISELGAFSQEVSASVTEVGNSSAQTAAALEQGKGAVRKSVDYIQQIQQTVIDNSQSVRELVEQTMEIDKFVTAIQDIASQTNLLALNAAIEAARAGAEGRGFAVVANEVKKLAEISGKSASEISNLLETIKLDAQETLDTLGQSVTAVTEGTQLILTAGKSLDEIMDAVSETTSLVEEISSAVSQQATNNGQLMSVTENMQQVLEKAALFIETASFDAEQQQASVQTLLNATTSMRAIEQEMQLSLRKVADANRAKTVYRFGLPQDPVTLDPCMSRDSNSNYIIRELFVGLLQVGEEGKPVPGIAASWHLEDDGCTYSFMLRPNVYFHHGRQVEAQDVKYSLERLIRPGSKSPHGGLAMSILGADEFSKGQSPDLRGIKVTGKLQISITLKSPNLVFLHNLSNLATAIVPRDIVEQAGENFARQPVGAGPFRFDHWTPGEELKLSRNERYFEGKAFVDEVLIRIYRGAESQFAGFLSGEIDHMRSDSSGYQQLASHPVYSRTMRKLPAEDIQYCAMMNRKPPFDNPLVRQAANHAFNRPAYLKEVLQDQAVLSDGPLPPSFLAGKVQGFEYNPTRAKALMREAGFPNGYPEEIILHVRANNQEQAKRAEWIASDLAEIGLQLRIVTLPWTELVKPENMAKCNMFLMAATGGHSEGMPYLEPYFHSRGIGKGNRVGYSNPEVDALLDQVETVASPERRRQLYIEAAKRISADAPWMWLFHPFYYAVHQPEVKGFRVGPGGVVNVRNFWKE